MTEYESPEGRMSTRSVGLSAACENDLHEKCEAFRLVRDDEPEAAERRRGICECHCHQAEEADR